MARRRTYHGAIEKRGENYRVDLVVSGVRFRKTLRGVTRAQVEAFLRQKREEMKADSERRSHGLPLGDGTALALIDDFRADHFPELEPRSRSSYATTLKLFSTWLETKPGLRSLTVRDVSPHHIRDFLTWVRNNSYTVSADVKRKVNPKPHTMRRHRAALHKMFNYAVNELELRDYNHVSKVKTKKPDDFDPVILDDH